MTNTGKDSLFPVGASYRDPRARVYEYDRRILRAISKTGFTDYKHTLRCGFYDHAEKQGWLVPTVEVTDTGILSSFPDAKILLEHERIPLISYPYEWTFAQLKDAALLQLDLHLSALQYETTMLDSSAYNIQFRGVKPIFIDYCSFAPYVKGSLWAGHHQFCEQFLNPLLLHAKADIEFQPWYRGAASGIHTSETYRALPRSKFFSTQSLLHVVAKHFLDRKAKRDWILNRPAPATSPRKGGVSKKTLVGMLLGLRRFIAQLSSPTERTLWESYDRHNTYSNSDRSAKHSFVEQFCGRWKPSKLIDLGGNTGEFSETAIVAGVREVVLVDSDHGALMRAYKRGVQKSFFVLPLMSNIMDLSPAQGWRNLERVSLEQRLIDWQPDALLALALVHHLAIAGNAPLDQVVDWVLSLAPRGVIEFVPKSDPTVLIMLKYRQDIFADYSLENFRATLSAKKHIVNEQQLDSGRILFEYAPIRV
jgi:ribosomal protein L11 methylase PrmA